MLLSIDPGVNNCGVSVVDYSEVFRVVEVFNVNNARKFSPEEKVQELKFGTRVVKVTNILNQLSSCLDRYPGIDRVSIEAPFYNALTPVAYGSLLEVITAIKYNLLLPRAIPFSMTEPLLVKKLFIGQKITRDTTAKAVMRLFMEKKVADKLIFVDKLVEEMTEHEIDAIAIAYVNVIKLLEEKRDAELQHPQ